MKVFMFPQLGTEWWECHRGIPSASSFDRIITPAKGELSKQADDYIDELIGDLLCQSPNYFTERGKPVNSFAMQQGIDVEPEARNWLKMDADMDISEVGFCVNDSFTLGCSPDGTIALKLDTDAAGEIVPAGEYQGHQFFNGSCEATVELKCPLLKNHISYLRKGVLPPDYKPQCHGHMIVTGATYCEFVSYGRGVRPLRVKVERDSYTDKAQKAVNDFVDQYREAVEKIRTIAA